MPKPPALVLRSGPVLFYDVPEFVIYAGKGGYGVRFTIFLAVRNDAYHKRVGVVWRPVIVEGTGSQPDWQTTHLSYIGPLYDNIELWGGSSGMWGPVVNFVELAAFAEMNGVTHWDNGNGRNYHVRGDGLPSPARPVATVASLTAGSREATTFEGNAFVWPYEAKRQLHVLYSADEWHSVGVVEATADSTSKFTWKATLPSTDDDVRFVVCYTVGGVEFLEYGVAENYTASAEERGTS